IPSAEYGDISTGIVKVSTRKGKTPYTVSFTTNPRTKQVSLSKGFDLGKNRGVLNSSVEYTDATKNPTSPYTSYTRTGLSLNYQNIFAEVFRFNIGVTGNIGGMNTKDDPDAFVGEFEKDHDNAVRVNTSLNWQLNKSWITNVDFSASINYEDNLVKSHTYNSNASQTPAVHAQEGGYFLAEILPFTYFATQYIDSKELDYAANLKASWMRSWGDIRSNAKLGVSWTANGNVGKGEYYADPKLSPDGYRPRPYTDIPYMHNVAGYLEETLTLPLGSTSLQIMAGVRVEKTFIEGSDYKKTSNVSPRLNFKYRVADYLTIRGGWGLTEKLPSFSILYPNPQYRDTRIFSASYGENQSIYVYNTQPYSTLYNPDLRWQRNRNIEIGVDFRVGETQVSLVGYFNKTKYPYAIKNEYDPFAYKMGSVPSTLPDGEKYNFPKNPLFKVDNQSGEIFVRDADNMDAGWVTMASKEKRMFVKNLYQSNGSPVNRMGLEFVIDFPQINPIRTQLRLDGAYAYTKYVNEGEAWYNPSIKLNGEPYPYVGIYADNGGNPTTTYNGRETHALDVNLMATTHIPAIRLIISLRLEASLVKRSQNISRFRGKEYAFNVGSDGTKKPTGGSIYDGNSYTAIYPHEYIDLDGNRHPFTDVEAANPDFSSLILQSGNAYQYN
ncbi:MAG: TonB-dependent receptor, partial [Alistipes sp.]